MLLVTSEFAVGPGEWLLQTAAGSTVGKLVLQLGRHVGFRTINVVRRRAAIDALLKLGGTAAICSDDEDIVQRASEIAGDEGIRKAIDSVAGLVPTPSALAPGGEMIVYGALSAHRQTDPDRLTIPLPASTLIYGTKRVRGFWLYRWFSTTPQEQIAAALSHTFGLVAGGTIRIPEGQPLPLAQFADAVRLAEAPGHGGKPLLLFND
jgi:NADPH:quinone reductase-like Zn-dependent oxidoreductase